MDQSTAVLGLLAETPIHAGVGQMVGVIDLPIQREAHTGWPCVFGSAVKGALRTRAVDVAGEVGKDWIYQVFGPDTNNASDHAGALTVGDARLLLLPVRSLTSHFKWVTCPALVQRYDADRRRLGLSPLASIPAVQQPHHALVPKEQTGGLFLEEFRFTPVAGDLAGLTEALACLMAREEAVAALGEQLVIVHNDTFSHLSRFATPVAAHVTIDNQRKTVKKGGLWYEETLPPETLLYVALTAQASRKKDSSKTSADVLSHIRNDLFPEIRPYLQLGGNETVGMGWTKVAFLGEEEHHADAAAA